MELYKNKNISTPSIVSNNLPISTNNISKSRKYNTLFRKKLLSKFENILDKNFYMDIYDIISIDNNIFSTNINGIFIDINRLSDTCIENILTYINNYTSKSNNTSTPNFNNYIYKLDDVEMLTEIGHKLSSQEKCIIKRMKGEINF